MNRTTMLIALLAVLILGANRGYAEQPPSPCHPNPNADQDMAAVAARGDIARAGTTQKHWTSNHKQWRKDENRT